MHVYRALRQILGPDDDARWLRSANSGVPFLGRSPIEFMLQGRVADLLDTHRYLRRAS
jgi:hypothetical protein